MARPTVADAYPHLVDEWHPEKNGDLTPADVTAGSMKRAWWVCTKCSHQWVTSVQNRSRGSGCAVCSRGSRQRRLAHEVKPELAAEFAERNDVDFATLTTGTSRKFWWSCPAGHEYEASVANRVNLGAGCPFCAGRKSQVRTTVADGDPAVLARWHPDRNDMSPSEVYVHSHKKVWWLCERGHTWDSSPSQLTNGWGCPWCSGRRTLPEESLAAKYPDVAKQWVQERNGEVTPETIRPYSPRNFWWRCDEGHEWRTAVNYRTAKRSRCPYCHNFKVNDENSLATLHPDLAAEWHPERNGRLTPDALVAGSMTAAWWTCAAGHEWQARVNSRSQGGHGCKQCASRYDSRVQTDIELYLHHALQVEIPCERRVHEASRYYRQADVLLNPHRLVVEFDGAYWHRDSVERDTRKVQALRSAGFQVIRIRQKLEPITDWDIVTTQYTTARSSARKVLNQMQAKGLLDRYVKIPEPLPAWWFDWHSAIRQNRREDAERLREGRELPKVLRALDHSGN